MSVSSNSMQVAQAAIAASGYDTLLRRATVNGLRLLIVYGAQNLRKGRVTHRWENFCTSTRPLIV
jgi:hypothetical protein